jgi:hypothetical protein
MWVDTRPREAVVPTLTKWYWMDFAVTRMTPGPSRADLGYAGAGLTPVHAACRTAVYPRFYPTYVGSGKSETGPGLCVPQLLSELSRLGSWLGDNCYWGVRLGCHDNSFCGTQ